MTKEVISICIALLLGIFGLIVNTKDDDKGIQYIVFRNLLWFLFAGCVAAAPAFYIHSHYQDFFFPYIIVILIITTLLLFVLSLYLRYKLYITAKTVLHQTNADCSAGAIAFNSNKAYNDTINPLEENAKEIISLTKRINIVFKPDELIKEMAEQRFGKTSFERSEKNNYKVYVNAHKKRKQAFYSYLAAGKTYYEIYCGEELENYVETFYHNGTHDLNRKYLSELISNWLKAIREYDNYNVIICCKEGAAIPLKYKIYDRKYVVMHDSVGKHPQNRVNSFMITDGDAVSKFVLDFETIWNLADYQNQSKESICQWIQVNLVEKYLQEG